jgi:hypothetical protein
MYFCHSRIKTAAVLKNYFTFIKNSPILDVETLSPSTIHGSKGEIYEKPQHYCSYRSLNNRALKRCTDCIRAIF